MRKATLLIAVLLCFGLATAFAGPVQVEPEYEATASATWGIQLDDQASGFQNSAESKILFTFIEEQTAEYGEGTTYGYIMVEDFEVEFETPDDSVANGSGTAISGNDDVSVGDSFTIDPGEITAKVFFGPAYLKVYDGADDEVDEIDHLGKINSDVTAPAATVGVDPNIALDPTTEYGGVALGFELPDLVTVELGVASQFDWEQGTTTVVSDPSDVLTTAQETNVNTGLAAGFTLAELRAAGTGIPGASDLAGLSAAEFATLGTTDVANGTSYNERNAYVWSLNAEISPVDMVTVNLVSNMWYGVNGNAAGEAGNPASVGLSAEYSMPLTDDIDLVPTVGFDYVTEQDGDEDQESFMEFGGSVAMIWPGLGLDEDEDDHIDFLPGDEEVTSGVSLGAVYGIHSWDLITAGNPLVANTDADESVNTLAMKLGLYEDGGDDGFLPLVGAAAVLNYNMVFENKDLNIDDPKSDLGLGLELNADLGVVGPYAGMIYEVRDLAGNYDKATSTYMGSWYADDDANATQKTNFQVNVGTDINVVPNTTFTIDYASGNLMWDEKENGASTYGSTYTPFSGMSGQAMAGEFSIETSIEF